MSVSRPSTGAGASSTTGSVGVVSSDNSTASALVNGASFTGTWEDVSQYPSVVVSVATDQDGTYQVQFSTDGVNADSTLTRYYRTDQIEPPHRFTITRMYCRVVFTNDSGADQTYLRLQTLLGNQGELNAPADSTLAQDFDATPTRPTDYRYEVTLGRRQGATVWSKFGYNDDIDSGTEAVVSWGGTFVPLTTARTLSVVSTSANDTSAGTGARSILIYGLDANREQQTVSVTMNGTTPVVTTETWLGINRMVVTSAGSGQENAGDITATATTDATIQWQIPTGSGTSQQCVFHVQAAHQGLIEWVRVEVIREGGGGSEPVVTLVGWVFSHVTNCVYEVLRTTVDANIGTSSDLKPVLPFPIDGSTSFYLEATSDRANTQVRARFSLTEIRNVDA